MIKHLIVVRMNYSDEDLFLKRYEITKTTFIPSLLGQINKDFTIAFHVQPQHQSIIDENFKNEPFKVEFFKKMSEIRDYSISEKFNIQTRIDSDDIFLPEYVDILQKIYLNNINTNDKFLIQTQPYKLNHKTGEHFRTNRRYINKITSMFLTLCQSNVVNFIMDRQHDRMFEITDHIISTDEGLCELVIHNENIFSSLSELDTKIETKKVSIIIPTFNNVGYIDECLMSIIESSKDYDFEILVGIDNCEKTLEYVKTYQDKYINTKFYLFDDSVGPYVIKNTLTQISKSNNILFFDSDDIMSPECVPTVMEHYEKYGSIRFNFNNFVELSKPYKNKVHAEGVFFIKKSYFNFLNGFEPWKCAADSEFHKRVIENDIKTNYLDNIMFLRRIHNVSLTKNQKTGMRSSIRRIYHNVIKEKQKSLNYGPLNNLIVHRFFYVNGNNLELVSDETNFTFFSELNDVKNDDIIKKKHKVIPEDFNPNKEREVINKDIIIPQEKSEIEDKPIIQNKPKDRNKLFELKKETLFNMSRKIGVGRGKKSPNKLYI